MNGTYHGLQKTLELRQRELSGDQMRIFEAYTGKIFATLALDLDTTGTRETPRRFIRALLDATIVYDGDPKLVTVFESEFRDKSGPT